MGVNDETDKRRRAGAAGDLWRYDPWARVWTDLTQQVRRRLLIRQVLLGTESPDPSRPIRVARSESPDPSRHVRV